MNFDRILSGYRSKTCVISVEKYPDGGYGNIRIAAGNKAHCDDMLQVMHRPFVPDSPYGEYLPQNKNFEDYCYRCAILGQPLHAYVPLPQMGLWLNMFLLPLESDREDLGYCVYSYDIAPQVDSEKRAALSADTAAGVLKTCIKLRGSEDLRQTAREIIEDIRQICDSDRCCILLTDRETRSCINFCEAIKPGCGLPSMDTYLDEGLYEVVQTWDATIGDSTCVILKDERDMEWLKSVNPLWHKSLTNAGTRSLVLLPLKNSRATIGYLWAVNFNTENTVKIKETLELTSFFVASEISNYQLLHRLEILGSIDTLTGVQNRNKMNLMVDDVVSGRTVIQTPYAIVFADLNGLKRINDEEGHIAGDMILKKAAEVLRTVFPRCDIYRAGGDEFMVLAPGMDDATLRARQKRVKEAAEAVEGLVFAVGACMVRGDEDIRAAMRFADQAMYADKKEYYADHPDQKYR